jgi:hypothetical protein
MKALIALSSSALPLASATSLAEGTPSAKSAIQLSGLTLLDETTGQCKDILQTILKTSAQKDIIATVALEAGLFTETQVKSKNGTEDSSTARSSIKVRLLVDDNPAYPGQVTYAEREQKLMASLGGVLNCYDYNGDGSITFDECTLTEEQISLMQRTLNANTFVFALDDVGTGVHTIKVQACVSTYTQSGAGTAAAKAWVGKGALSVEEVRLVKGSEISM